MSGLLDQILQAGFLAAMIRIATPLALATIGEMFSERSGVLNLGIEGIMLIGAMTGFSTAYFTGSLWLGVAMAAVVGALFGALVALLAVSLGLSQHVSGLGVTLLASGLAFFVYRLVFGQPSVPPAVPSFQTVPIPGLSSIPGIGSALFDQYLLVYAAMILVPVAALVLFRTPWGLGLRLVGESPEAADSAGINVIARRWQAVCLGGALMGVAGAFLSLAQFNSFTFGVISGRGWVCIALVVFGQWKPWRCAAGALIFAFIDALQLRLQASGLGAHIPYEAFLILPFLLTIVAMASVSRNSTAPAALLKPFRKEER